MRCRTPKAAGFRAMLTVLLGAAVVFAFTPFQAQAQRRGFSAGARVAGHARAPRGGFHRGGGGAGFGGWTNSNGTWSSYTYNHGPGQQGRPFRGRGYAPLVALPQPLYYLPFNYGFGDYGLGAFDADDDGPDDANSAPPPPEPGPAETTLEMNQAALATQLQQLHAEIQNLQAAQAPVPAPHDVQQPGASEPAQTPVTIVLRNGQQLQADDYAIMNGTFWDFSNRPLRKIPLSNIDVAASQQATEATGGEFPAIGATP